MATANLPPEPHSSGGIIPRAPIIWEPRVSAVDLPLYGAPIIPLEEAVGRDTLKLVYLRIPGINTLLDCSVTLHVTDIVWEDTTAEERTRYGVSKAIRSCRLIGAALVPSPLDGGQLVRREVQP